MNVLMVRGAAAAGTVAVAAAVNIATGELTDHWAAAWWAATAILVVLGGGLQWWLTGADDNSIKGTAGDRDDVELSASGRGSIAAGGSVRNASIRVTAGRKAGPEPKGRINASGAGAVAAGHDVVGTHIEVRE